MQGRNRVRAVLLGVGISAAVCLGGTAALAQKVHTDYDHSAPFSDFHTFSFGKVQTTNPLDTRRVQDEIVRDLTYHGWKEVPTGGDVVVTAVEAEHDSKEYQTFYDGLGPGFGWGGWGGWWGMGWGGMGMGMGGDSTTSVHSVPVGTLMVDLYDQHTHNLIWRGVSKENVSSNMNKDTGQLQKAVDEMFYKFPPKTQK
jgi:hypothetical protein